MLYGALTNPYFRYFDLRMGESTTCTGRLILNHQCAKVNELMTGEYDVYGESMIYGDSVAGDTVLYTSDGDICIKDLFDPMFLYKYSADGKEYCHTASTTLTYDTKTENVEYRSIKYVVRHKVSKKMYRVWGNRKYVDVTEDHSLIGYNGRFEKVKPTNLINYDIVSITESNQIEFTPPIRIEEIEYDDYVYDVEVEGTHTFFGNGLLLHNTDSSYFSLFSKDESEAIAAADAVADQVTPTFKPFMQKTFLCNPGFDDLIKAGREIVASRGIFVSKKRYILRVIDNEGVTVDKLKVMGLDTKKTTIPAEVGNKLNNFVGRLLRGETWDVIAQDIVDYKAKLATTDDIMSIGLPKGVQKVEYYTAAWDTDKNTRLPGHVAASIHYNNCLKEYSDNSSIPIISGMKIKVFYLTQTYGRFHSIALPTDIEVIPEWFLENFTVHRDKHIERLVDKPLGNILEAIGKKTPSAQSLFVDDLFGI